jgi:hypothetical protein
MPPSLLDSNLQKANSAILQACNVPGQLCARDFIYGPSFFRGDWTLQKTTRIREHVNFELRVEFLNVFNTTNFYYAATSGGFSSTGANLQSTTFGQITSAYQDIDSTDDPGGRIIQIVGRINF